MEQAATPSDAGNPGTVEAPADSSLDDRLLVKFGITEAPQAQPEATPAPQAQEATEEAEPQIVEEESPEVVPAEFELKHNGEMKKVPMSEAQRLAQMGYDYEFKMQRVNDDAAKVKGMAQALQAQQAVQAQIFGAMVEVKAIERQLAPYANVDWVAQANADPEGTFRLRMQHDALVRSWQEATGKAQQLAQQQQPIAQQIDAATAELENRKLLDRIPEWKDDSKRSVESKAILETMVKDYGFAQNELGGPLLHDHRVIALLRDAYRFRAAIAKTKANKGQLQGLPKTATPGARVPPKSEAQVMGDIKRALHQPNISKEQRKVAQDELIARKFKLK